MASAQDFAEIARSASEAKKTTLQNIDLRRYQNPSPNTCYALEYAFFLLPDIREKVVLDLGCGSGQSRLDLVGALPPPQLGRVLEHPGAEAPICLFSSRTRAITASNTGSFLDRVTYAASRLAFMDLPQVRVRQEAVRGKASTLALNA